MERPRESKCLQSEAKKKEREKKLAAKQIELY